MASERKWVGLTKRRKKREKEKTRKLELIAKGAKSECGINDRIFRIQV